MDCVLPHKSKIDDTYNSVREFSYYEKKSALVDENKINAFLDTINKIKKYISEKTEKIVRLNEGLESLTWYGELDDECLMKVNDIISSSKDLHSTLIRQYISFNFIRSKGMAKKELKAFKEATDDLRENADDLESAFFILPKIQGFTETMKAFIEL